MKIETEKPNFKPIKLVLETPEEVRKLIDCMVIVYSQSWTTRRPFAKDIQTLLQRELYGN